MDFIVIGFKSSCPKECAFSLDAPKWVLFFAELLSHISNRKDISWRVLFCSYWFEKLVAQIIPHTIIQHILCSCIHTRVSKAKEKFQEVFCYWMEKLVSQEMPSSKYPANGQLFLRLYFYVAAKKPHSSCEESHIFHTRVFQD